jgi:hypothetical protein
MEQNGTGIFGTLNRQGQNYLVSRAIAGILVYMRVEWGFSVNDILEMVGNIGVVRLSRSEDLPVHLNRAK